VLHTITCQVKLQRGKLSLAPLMKVVMREILFLICGPPLRNCSETNSQLQPVPNNEQEDNNGFIDMDAFTVSLEACYIIVSLAIAAALYINPYWRRRCF